MPEDATAIIINSPTVDFNEEDAQKVIDYLNGGGKAMIVGCYAYNDELTNFNKILAAYNVSFKTGVVAEMTAQNIIRILSTCFQQLRRQITPQMPQTDMYSWQEAVQSIILRIQMM